MSTSAAEVRKPELNKWFFDLSLTKNYRTMDGRILRIECFKFIKWQPEATVPIHGEHYKGFMFEINLRNPVSYIQWR